MTEAERITDQLRRAFEKHAWHGPSLQELLADVPAGKAARRPIPEAHSIWELVRHIAAWESVVRRRLAGERLVELSPEQDWPAVTDVSEAAWKQTMEELERGHLELRQAIARWPDTRLPEIVPGQKYSFYVMLHGVIQHDLYHAGQIAVLKKGA